jgi:hypothetical protein
MPPMLVALWGPTESRQGAKTQAVPNVPAQVRSAVTHSQGSLTVTGRSSRRNAQYSSLSVVQLRLHQILILPYMQYSASYYAPANCGSSYPQVVLVGGRDLWRPNENLSVL